MNKTGQTPEQYPRPTEVEARANKSLEWLIDPQPVIFDPQPGGADLPAAAGGVDLSATAGADTSAGSGDVSGEAAAAETPG